MLSPEDIQSYQPLFRELAPEDLASILQQARNRSLSAGEIYIRQGVLSCKIAFITKGLIRAWQSKDLDQEITLMLRWENQFVASFDGIISNKPSRFVYQAMEDTEIVELDYKEIEPLLDNNARLASARNYFLMHMLADAIDRVEGYILLSPEERYRKLLSERTDIVNRVPDKHLATMLGITPVSLSRIRKRMTATGKR